MTLRMTRVLILLGFLLPFSSATARANGKIRIHVELNPAGSFVAESNAVKGSAIRNADSLTAQNVTLDLNTLKTGVTLRDQHMKEKYFETQTFPQALLAKGLAKDGKFVGELIIRSVPKKITGTSSVEGANVAVKFKCTLSDFNIKSASYMGVGVEDEVEVEVALPIAEASPAKYPTPAKSPGNKS